MTHRSCLFTLTIGDYLSERTFYFYNTRPLTFSVLPDIYRTRAMHLDIINNAKRYLFVSLAALTANGIFLHPQCTFANFQIMVEKFKPRDFTSLFTAERKTNTLIFGRDSSWTWMNSIWCQTMRYLWIYWWSKWDILQSTYAASPLNMAHRHTHTQH